MKRNLQHWTKSRQVPALLDRAALKVTPDTALVLQLGDIVQGNFGSKEKHQQALELALAEFLRRFTKVPFAVVPGNYDYLGPRAQAGYQESMSKYLNRTLGLSLAPGKPVQYVWTRDRDLWVILDYGHPDPAFLERAVAEHPDLRHLIVLTHWPVIPVSYPGSVYWWKNVNAAARQKLIRLLAKHHAIVLTAHIHMTTRVVWQCPEGSIAQLSLFSIFTSKENTVSVTERNPKNPFPNALFPTWVGNGSVSRAKARRPRAGSYPAEDSRASSP